MSLEIWQKCLGLLEGEYPAQQFNTWLRPLQVETRDDSLVLLAPNRFVVDWVKKNFFNRINEVILQGNDNNYSKVVLEIGSKANERPVARSAPIERVVAQQPLVNNSNRTVTANVANTKNSEGKKSYLNRNFVFDSFVEGNSNQLAKAAAQQVGENPGNAYNPVFIYGGVGLGKTHLMHAIGNQILAQDPNAKVLYLHSERFVADMVKALQTNKINEFKRFYRSLDALLIDDIQFFAGKDRSQEEFFHTFNALLEGQQQIILRQIVILRRLKGSRSD